MQGPRYILRNRSQVLKGILLIAFGAALVVVTALDPVEASFLPPGMAALGLAGIAAAVFILPRVIVDQEGVETRNWVYRVRVPWNQYRKLDTRFGMYFVSSDHRDVVASYPGAGGLSKGREELGPNHRLGKSTPRSAGLPLHTSGTKKHWADMNQSIGLIENVYTHDYLKDKKSKSHTPAPGTRAYREAVGDEDSGRDVGGDALLAHRTKTLDLGSAACLIIGGALLLVGIAFSMV